jgi:hypothetical protein
MKNKFIRKTEESTGILSSLYMPSAPKNYYEHLIKNNVEVIYEEKAYDSREDKFTTDIVILKTKQNFYIQVKVLIGSNYVIFYYKPSQYNELNLFIKQSLKDLK